MKLQVERFKKQDTDFIFKQRFGERYEKYRKIWNEVSKNNIPKFPPHLDFELFDKCNQSCIMCARNESLHPNIQYRINTKEKLDFDLFRKIIKEGAEKELFSVNFGAFSEPFVHSDCLKMVEYAHANGLVDSRIISNGLLLGKFINEIFQSGLAQLFISLDAFTEKTYLQIRGKGFHVIQKNIHDIIEEKNKRKTLFPVIRVSFVEMDINKSEKNDFIKYWTEKVDFVDVQPYQNENAVVSLNLKDKKKFNCESPFGRLAILANGDVIPCCNFYGRSLVIGNAKKDTIFDIWNSKKMNQIRNDLNNETSPTCETCQRN